MMFAKVCVQEQKATFGLVGEFVDSDSRLLNPCILCPSYTDLGLGELKIVQHATVGIQLNSDIVPELVTSLMFARWNSETNYTRCLIEDRAKAVESC